MRILVLAWRDPTHPEAGGSEVYVHQIAQELVGRGDEVVVFCPRPTPESRLVRDGVTYLRRGGKLTVYARGLAYAARHRARFDAVLDVINGIPFAARLVHPNAVGLIHHLHRDQWQLLFPGWRGRLGWFIESKFVPWLYRNRPMLTVSSATAHDLTNLGFAPNLLVVAPNAVDSPPARVARARDPRLCVVARLVPHKRIDWAIRVVAALESEFPKLHLDVIGDGFCLAQLQELARRLAVTHRVQFHGRVSAATRDALVGQAWVHLMPSRIEGWCLAIGEAAAAGVPSVAVREAGGVTASLQDGVTGLLADDFPSFVAHTRALLNNSGMRHELGDQGQRLMRTTSWTSSAEIIRETLHSHAYRAERQSP